MQLQISTDYAIRILQHLYKNEGELHTAMSIAESIDITYPFFIKIANKLKRDGFLRSVQGRNGGYVLGKRAHKINFYDVFVCMEGELQISKCLKRGSKCQNGEQIDCKMHMFLQGLQGTIIAEMSGKSIMDFAC